MSSPRQSSLKLLKALAAAGLSAVLVGCGGGSSDSSMNTDPPGEPGPTEAEMQAMAIKRAIDASQSAIGRVTPMAGPSQVAAADRALAALKMAIDEATELSEEVLDGYETTYDAHSLLLRDSKLDRTAYLKEQEEKRLADAKKMRDDRAKLWIAAIENYKVETSPNKFDSLRSEVSDLHIDNEDNIKLDDENTIPISPETHISPSRGWIAKKFTKTDGESWGVVVTNELSHPTRLSWTEYFYNDHPKTTSAKTTLNPPLPGVTPVAGGKVEFAASINNTFDVVHFGGRVLPKIEINGSISGIYRGVPGVYECKDNTATCETSPASTDDKFRFDQQYTFTPNEDGTGSDPFDNVFITVAPRHDGSHLAFGYWLTEVSPTQTERPKYNIHTFAEDYMGGYGDHTTSVSELQGSASYTGGAAGVYVLKEGDLTDNPDLYDGEFVAVVNLEAQFAEGNGTVAAVDQWKITGTIDDFRSEEASHNLSGWELALEADLGSDRSSTTGVMATPALALTNPVTMGGGTNGTWNAAFFGSDGTNNATDHPEAIAGEFNGHFINGHVVGAFGAEKED